MTLHTYTHNQCPYKVSTSHTIQFPRHSLNKILEIKVTIARSNIKSRLHHDAAHLHPQPISLPSINILHLIFFMIYPTQDFKGQNYYSKVKGQINVTTKYQHITLYGF